jgi:hypothetical protein
VSERAPLGAPLRASAPPPGDAALRDRARRAYERGRLRHAAGLAAPVAALALLAGLPGVARAPALAVAGLGFALTLLVGHLRTHLGRGARAGALFGVVPFASGVWMAAFGHACGPAICAAVCTGVGLAGGLVWGALVGQRARRHPPGYGVAAIVCALAVGGLGCHATSLGALLDVAAGLAAGALLIALRGAPARV